MLPEILQCDVDCKCKVPPCYNISGAVKCYDFSKVECNTFADVKDIRYL